MSQFACRVAVIVFFAKAKGSACPTALNTNDGTTTFKGFDPLLMPSSTAPGTDITEADISAPDGNVANTRTDRASCGTAPFRTAIRITASVEASHGPDTKKTAWPAFLFHMPEPTTELVAFVATGMGPSGVSVPVSPTTVMLVPGSSSQSASSVSEMTFDAPASGLLWPMARTVKDGTAIRSGSDPLLIPSRTCPAVVIAAAAITAPDGNDATADTAGEFCATRPFFKAKLSTTATVPGQRVSTVRSRRPSTGFHDPNGERYSVALDITGRCSSVCAEPLKPIIVMLVPESKSQFASKVNESVLKAAANGSLCPMA